VPTKSITEVPASPSPAAATTAPPSTTGSSTSNSAVRLDLISARTLSALVTVIPYLLSCLMV
ncbi:unnamed protein product, partial [Rhizoctonia solani]